MTSDNQFRF